MEIKEQLNEAEKVLWRIFNLTEVKRPNKAMLEVRRLISEYLDLKVNGKRKI